MTAWESSTKTKKNSSTKQPLVDRFFTIGPRDLLLHRRLPFPLFLRSPEGNWIRTLEAGTLLDEHTLPTATVFTQVTGRMSWAGFLVSLVESSNASLNSNELGRILSLSGQALMNGWSKAPGQPEYTALTHRWSAALTEHAQSLPFREMCKHLPTEGDWSSHSVRCAMVLGTLGQFMPWSKDTRRWMAWTGLAHDLGHSLEGEDRTWSHIDAGLGLLAGHHPLPEFVYLAIKHHHERMNGQGFPYGLDAEQIPWSARLLGLIDEWDETEPIHGSMLRVQGRWEKFCRRRADFFDPDWLHRVASGLDLVSSTP